jgi:hypothetical protein
MGRVGPSWSELVRRGYPPPVWWYDVTAHFLTSVRRRRWRRVPGVVPESQDDSGRYVVTSAGRVSAGATSGAAIDPIGPRRGALPSYTVRHAAGQDIATGGVAVVVSQSPSPGRMSGGRFEDEDSDAGTNRWFLDEFNAQALQTPWVLTGTWAVSNGNLFPTAVGAGSPGLVARMATAPPPDVAVACVYGVVTPGVNTPAPFARGSFTVGNLSGYLVGIRDVGQIDLAIQLERWTGGTTSAVLGTHLHTPDVGDSIELECQGTTLRVLLNGVQVVSATDATYADGLVGLAGNAIGAGYDRFSARSL